MSRDHLAEGLGGLGKVRHTVPVTQSGEVSVDMLTGTRSIGHRASMAVGVEGGRAGQQSECDDGEHEGDGDRIGMMKVLGDEAVFRDLPSKDDG